MKKSSSIVKYILALMTIFSLSPQISSRPFDWYYNSFAAPFALFYNPALIGNNPGPTVGIDTRYADSADYDARVAFTVPLSKVMKREERLRENILKNVKHTYTNSSYMSSETSISFGGIYTAEEDYHLGIGFTTPIRMIQTGITLGLEYRNDPDSDRNIAVGTVNVGLSSNMIRNSIFFFTINKANNILMNDQRYINDIGFSIGTSGNPFFDTGKIFLPYDVLFTYMSNGNKFAVGRLMGTLRLNLDLTDIYTSRDITGQMIMASIGYNVIRDEYRRVSHSVFASIGMKFINKASSSALAGEYNMRSGRNDETHGAFMYSLVNKTGVFTDNYLISNLQCMTVDSNRVVFGMDAGDVAINSWVLKIETHGGDNIKTFSGGNVIPASIIWDGLNSEGDKLEDDIVYAKLVVRGDRRVIESKLIGVEIIDGRPRPKKDL